MSARNDQALRTTPGANHEVAFSPDEGRASHSNPLLLELTQCQSDVYVPFSQNGKHTELQLVDNCCQLRKTPGAKGKDVLNTDDQGMPFRYLLEIQAPLCESDACKPLSQNGKDVDFYVQTVINRAVLRTPGTNPPVVVDHTVRQRMPYSRSHHLGLPEGESRLSLTFSQNGRPCFFRITKVRL